LDALFGPAVVRLLRERLPVHGIIATELALGQVGAPDVTSTAP
jgi:hypothetical protein